MQNRLNFVNGFDAKKSTCCTRVLVVTELVVRGSQYKASLNRPIPFSATLGPA